MTSMSNYHISDHKRYMERVRLYRRISTIENELADLYVDTLLGRETEDHYKLCERTGRNEIESIRAQIAELTGKS